jgi:hypothetical protein
MSKGGKIEEDEVFGAWINEQIHKQYMLILEFLYPNEPIKQWVRDDITQLGSYHNDWNSFMKLARKLKDDYDDSMEIPDYDLVFEYIAMLDLETAYQFAVKCIEYINNERKERK